MSLCNLREEVQCDFQSRFTTRRTVCGDSPVRSHANGFRGADATRGAIFTCATHEKRRGAILETGLRTRDAVCSDSPVRSHTESDRRADATRGAIFACATHEKRRGAILETDLRTRDAVCGDSPSDRTPTTFAALRYGLSVQFLEKAVRFLQRRRFLLDFLLQPFTQSDCGA